jgi:hypothetical protein
VVEERRGRRMEGDTDWKVDTEGKFQERSRIVETLRGFAAS